MSKAQIHIQCIRRHTVCLWGSSFMGTQAGNDSLERLSRGTVMKERLRNTTLERRELEKPFLKSPFGREFESYRD